MDWKDTRTRAIWTAAESFLGAAVAFLSVLALGWVEAGAFTMPAGATVGLAAGAVAAVAAGATVVKEAVRQR